MHIPDETAPSTAGDVTHISNGSCVHIPDGTAHSIAGDVTRSLMVPVCILLIGQLPAQLVM